MTKRQRTNSYYKLEQIHKHLTDEGKAKLWELSNPNGAYALHVFDAVDLILCQHADMTLPTMATYLHKERS